MQFSYFKAPITNKLPYKKITLHQCYEAIKGAYFKKQTDYLRSITDAKKYRDEKTRLLDYVTFAGTFTKRENDSLKKLSGFMCLDLDHIPNLEAKKRKLVSDPFIKVQMIFTSPSGDGIKAVINNPYNTGDYSSDYKQLEDYMFQRYGLKIDKTSDVSRACLLCHDPKVWLKDTNPINEVFNQYPELIENDSQPYKKPPDHAGTTTSAPRNQLTKALDIGSKRAIPENASKAFKKLMKFPGAQHLNYHEDLEKSGHYREYLKDFQK